MNKLQEAIERAAKKSWSISIYIDESFESDEPSSGSLVATRGDGNCPHNVTYHPDDGHGYESYPKDAIKDYLESCWYSWDELITKLDNLPAVYTRELIVHEPAFVVYKESTPKQSWWTKLKGLVHRLVSKDV